MNSNEIIVVKQLPVIEQQLQLIKESVKAKVENACSLVCTEETVKDVKDARAELNKDFKELEAKRKEVKTAVLAPYESFEKVYKDCISNTFKAADVDLKKKIDSVENELKSKKAAEVKAVFEEYKAFKNIDFVTFEQAGVNITLSASTKSLKAAAKNFLDKISDDLQLIETQEHKTEILVEYKRSLNVSQAITSVSARVKAIEEEKARQAEREQREAVAKAAESKIEEIAPPEPLAAPAQPEKIVQMKFTVRGTIQQLKAIKNFLDQEGITYE